MKGVSVKWLWINRYKIVTLKDVHFSSTFSCIDYIYVLSSLNKEHYDLYVVFAQNRGK
ncbi:MAG: hypothetical protein ACI8ZM_004660 [Crocinitomix sp.]|jgi:hypothetical protein